MDSYLSLPVVIPQQRPGSMERGFMAAYAPSLDACGIDQTTMLQFIDDCNTAVQGNKYLAGVQVVSFGVGFTPEIIVMGVATAVQAGAYLANKSHVKHKTNTVLDKYNEEVFGPRGLYCMIMKYDPEVQDPRDSTPRSQNPLQKLGGFASSGRGETWFRDPISGHTQGAQSLPTAVAPLMYIDNRRQHKEMLSASRSSSSSPEPPAYSEVAIKQKPSAKQKAKKAFDYFNDYLDRRARARYAAENDDTILNAPSTRGFSNRYLDPNHAATNGGLIGLLSGGALSPDPETRIRKKMQRVEEEERRTLDEYHQRMESIRHQRQSPYETDRQLRRCEEDYAPRLAQFREQKRVAETSGRHIKKDVLYLMIVNRPSDYELAMATNKLDYAHGTDAVTTEKIVV